MKIYTRKENQLSEGMLLEGARDILWIDLLSPSNEERSSVERSLGVKIPSQEEMHEIESSSRLYQENDALIMTINLVKKENGNHRVVNITFILKGSTLVTLRYDDLVPLTMFLKLATTKPTFPVDSSVSLLLGILEAIIEKIADSLENISATVELISQAIFNASIEQEHDLRRTFISMGVQGEINSKARESLSTISRMVSYLKFNISIEDQKRFENRLQTLNLDALDLKDHSAFLGHKISFILDASLGLINIEQNNIIKILSVAAVVFLPPTLVGTIYGMNFQTMPELHWTVGYPLAIAIMILSSVLPYLYFKRKRWL